MSFDPWTYWNIGFPLAIILSMNLGYFWYGPCFNDVWMEYQNLSPRTKKQYEKAGGHGTAAIVCTLFLCYLFCICSDTQCKCVCW